MPVNRGKRAWRAPTPHLLTTLRSRGKDTFKSLLPRLARRPPCGLFCVWMESAGTPGTTSEVQPHHLTLSRNLIPFLRIIVYEDGGARYPYRAVSGSLGIAIPNLCISLIVINPRLTVQD